MATVSCYVHSDNPHHEPISLTFAKHQGTKVSIGSNNSTPVSAKDKASTANPATIHEATESSYPMMPAFMSAMPILTTR